MDNITLAYTAGLFDGEGSVGILSNKPIGAYKNRIYRLQVVLGMCDEATIRWLCETYGFRLYIKRPDNPKHNTAYLGFLQQQKAATFLRLIQPYLRTKAERVAIALEFADSYADWIRVRPKRKDMPTVPEVELERREAYFQKMRDLNFRGRRVDTFLSSGPVKLGTGLP